MSLYNTEIFLDGFKFTEGLRWHDDYLWFSDVWAQKVYCFDVNTKSKITEIIIDDQPVGLGWLTNDSLLIASLMNRELLIYRQNQLSVYKSLEIAAPGYCHDLVVSKNDVIYLSASGFMPSYGAKPVKSNILMISSDKKIKIAAKDIGYPNGIIITLDGKTLIVAETFSASVLSFHINEDGSLSHRQSWAKLDDLGFQVEFDKNGLPRNIDRHYPDGICFDEKRNAIWVASPGRKEVICVGQNNKILKTIKTRSHPFDCVLGGNQKSTLFIGTSDMMEKERTGKIELIQL